MDQIRSAIESVFRQESGKIVAGLIRISGSFDRAEEALQESFASALVSWPQRGIPDKPAAWIMAAAHRKLIDDARRDRTRREKMPALKYQAEMATLEPTTESLTMDSSDDRLRLIFTCCHPAINREAANRLDASDSRRVKHFGNRESVPDSGKRRSRSAWFARNGKSKRLESHMRCLRRSVCHSDWRPYKPSFI